MPKSTDLRCVGTQLYFLPVHTRMPLKFGGETVTNITCARVRLTVTDALGHRAHGWGETPLSVTWVWPGQLSYEERHTALQQFCHKLAEAWASFSEKGHPLEVGHDFQEQVLPGLWQKMNHTSKLAEPMPWLAALVCCSCFDLALHDAFGNLCRQPVYQTYNTRFMNRSLENFLTAAADAAVSFAGKFPQDFLSPHPPRQLPAWHLVGGLDPLDAAELTGQEPNDGYPVLLSDWIARDGLQCLKIKLRGTDAAWDFQRLARIGQISLGQNVKHLSADFNCTVTDPAYVNDILDRLQKEQPAIFARLLYVEQPFPYELAQHRIDVHHVAQRRPLFLDESAHDWKLIKFGRELGWTGVALKTCKTQTGALLSACWASAHGMQLMVQDLTNPMLAQIPHVLLAANVPTIMGVETNAMQFYPEASAAESKVHPGLYQRRHGTVDLSSIHGSGFGYRVEEISRSLPAPATSFV